MTDDTFGDVLKGFAQSPRGCEAAVVYPEGSLTWQELYLQSSRCAHRLVAKGVCPNDLVAIALPNGVEHHVWSFATWKAAATPCVLPSKLPGREIEQIVAIVDPRIIVGRAIDGLNGVEQIDPSDIDPIDETADLPNLAPNRWKAIASGGSTGRPKLIVDHAEGRYGASLAGLGDLVQMPSHGVILNPGPLYHNAAFLFTSLALFRGSKVVGMARFDPEECLYLIEAHRAEWVCLVPTMMHRIWSLPRATRERYDLSSLRTIWHMAAACPPWLKREWIAWLGADRIFEVYAGTEGAATIITGQEWLRKPGSVGRVSPGTLGVFRDDGAACEVGEIGEIFFPASARTKFDYIGATLTCDSEGRFSLGDLGHVDEDGYLFLADRRTDLILRGGANIYPAEVEAVLDEHPTVANAVVIGLPCEEFGQRIHAILEPASGTLCKPDQIDDFVRSRLSGYKCPESYEIVNDRLRDDAGKVRRSALRTEREDWMKNGLPFRIIIPRHSKPAITLKVANHDHAGSQPGQNLGRNVSGKSAG